jgi:periplasmic copper chaperone A
VNRLRTIIAITTAFLVSSCGQPPELKVKDAVVKLSPVDNNPSALYFTVHGGAADVDLVRVTSRSAIRVEMHETMADAKTGMMTMQAIPRIRIPAKRKVEFRRGGKHVMLWGINLPARRLEKIDMEFVFSNADRILVTAPIEKIAAGDSAHSGH